MLLNERNEVDRAFETMEKVGAEAVVAQGTFPTKQLADLALKHRLALATIFRSFTEAGALMSYGYQRTALYRHLALFLAKVLQGTKPMDLPVEQPTEFELVINRKAAKALGINIPPAFIDRADDEQPAVNPWRSPQRLGNAHLANELTNVQGRLWSAAHDCDFQRQYARKPARCQRRTVSGLKDFAHVEHLGAEAKEPDNSSRSMLPTATRFGDRRLITLS